MRKSIFFLVLAFFVLAYAGCSNKQITKNEGSTPDQNMSAAKTNESQAATPGTAKQMNGKDQVNQEQSVSRLAGPEKEKMELKDIHFDFDQYKIHPEDRQILASHADYLLKNRNVKIVIEGNCDERGTAEYNLALGNRRAKEAMNYLANLGIDTKRIKTVSYGKERPLDPAHNEEAWAKNRRDHFVAN